MRSPMIKHVLIMTLFTLQCLYGQEKTPAVDVGQTDRELAQILRCIRANLDGTTVLDDFNREQRAWEIYRDLHMKTLFPEYINAIKIPWGSVLSHDFSQEWISLSKERIKSLKKYMEPNKRTGTDGSGVFKEYLEELTRIQDSKFAP